VLENRGGLGYNAARVQHWGSFSFGKSMYDEDAIPLTPKGYQRLKEELERLTTAVRTDIAARIRDSMDHGEFSEENAELDEIKFEQSLNEERITELQEILANAHILTAADIPSRTVGIGSVVTLGVAKKKEETKVNVVSSAEADLDNDNVSDDSPLGRALMGRSKGDLVKVEAPAGTITYEIRRIGKIVR